MEFQYLDSYQHPIYLVLNLTDNCNLACKYCFVQQKPHYMTLEVAQKAVDYLEDNFNFKSKHGQLSSNDCKSIVFFGGEPTLMFNQIIEPIINYIEEKYCIKEYRFHITTNCTLLTEDKLQFLSKYNITPLLSIDGGEYTQNYNRPIKVGPHTSFELVHNNLPYILKYFPNATFRSTVYKDTIQYLYENYLYAESMGLKYFVCVPDSRSQNWTEEDLKLYEQQLLNIVTHITNQYLNNQEPKLQFLNLDKAFDNIIRYDMEKLQEIKRDWKNTFQVFRCGLGTSSCSINYKGDIFACQEQDSREFGDYFYLGNIFTGGIEEDRHSKIIKEYLTSDGKCENEELCNGCLMENYCSHGCPSAQQDLFHNSGKSPYIHCRTLQITMDVANVMMNFLTNENNELFTKYIDNKLKNSNWWWMKRRKK